MSMFSLTNALPRRRGRINAATVLVRAKNEATIARFLAERPVVVAAPTRMHPVATAIVAASVVAGYAGFLSMAFMAGRIAAVL